MNIPQMNRYFILHDRGTRYREVRAHRLSDVYLWANHTFGTIYAPPSAKNAQPQTAYKVYDDDLRVIKALFPNAKWSGLTELGELAFAPWRRASLGDWIADALEGAR